MWQSIAFGPNYKAAYCQAVCRVEPHRRADRPASTMRSSWLDSPDTGSSGGHSRSPCRSAKRSEAPAELIDEDRRLFERGEVAAMGNLLEPAKIGEELLGAPA